MILPPEEIKIKRKRTDEPVDILHIQEPLGKKQRCWTDFIFCRQLSHSAATVASATSQNIPNNHAPTLPLPSSSIDQKIKKVEKNDNVTIPRHFHIYHPKVIQTPNSELPSRKRKADTIFVERRVNSIRKPRLEENTLSSSVSSLNPKSNQCMIKNSKLPSDRNHKSPCKVPSPAPLRNVRLPSGDIIPWDVTSQELIAEMQAYTLSEINKKIVESEKERNSDTLAPDASSTTTITERKQDARFKPKAPTLRYKDRHLNKPELETDNGNEIESCESIEDESEDWVVEKYFRVPLEDTQFENHDNHGYLVLDSQAEIEEFFQDDSNSVEENEEDEDENAENHYTADYPDEEIELDDEFDFNAYNYTNDIDEFEIDTISDDEIDEKRKYPWAQKPWIGRQDKLNYDEDTDEDS
ncbi:hypothetical protein EV44_g1853 [Erysiphe necator]|uniref:Transcription factor Iwr1 domain-containing protein n=1 Tax=Uncinula necator TaxID=52586 RepID=A0A0B1P635_UNCNE|nr:hypothetical protein EV44_g1853 [Erysiphe necator]